MKHIEQSGQTARTVAFTAAAAGVHVVGFSVQYKKAP